MSYFIKIGASKLKQSPNFIKTMRALKYTIGFVKTCNLKMLYLVFGNEISLRHLIFNFQTHHLHTFMMQLLSILMKFTFL
jgi:hypothetical protein